MSQTNLKTAITILIIISMLSIAYAADVRVVNIGALQRTTLTFNLKDGQKFSGSLSITGGSGNDVNFWVTDPVGNRILDLGRVSGGRSFEFTAERDGAYTFNFDNSFSLLSSKTVTLTYDVSIAEIFDVGIPTFVYGLVILAVVVIVVAIAYYALKSSRTSKAYAPTQSETPSTAKFCTFCGTQNDNTALYCKNCGKQLQ